MILKHLDKDNLHHAYLVEGTKDEIVPEIFEFCESINIKTSRNPDFCHIDLDSFRIEDARNLRSYAGEKNIISDKKIFIISANNFLLEAQNSLLKMFEEPVENTHFFLVVPDVNSLLKTLVSRFYFISARQGLAEETNDAERFISMPLQERIDFIKVLLPKKDEDSDEEINIESNNSKALKFLNALESSLHRKFVSKPAFDIGFFEHFFKVREFLRMPGSSPKTLMESVAMIIPEQI